MKRRILVLQISHPVLTISAIASFISNFTELTTLECGEIYVHRDFEGDPLEYLLGTNETLDPPPSSITKLVFHRSGHLPSTVLEWFTDHHSGVIKSFSSHNLPTSHPIKFRNFINCFGASLSDIRLSISGNDDAGRQICFTVRISRLMLPHSSIPELAILRHAQSTQVYCVGSSGV
jgi:hypothetical protein